MPVMGANAPLSPPGAAVMAVAEILGSYILAKAVNREARVWALSLCSMMDMRSGEIRFCAPEVLAADIAICETTECYHRLPCRGYGGSYDATHPGLQATRDKLSRCLGLALYSQLTGFSGVLDRGRVFSLTQMVLDKDMHALLRHMARPHAVDEETLAVEDMVDIGWDTARYLGHAHTRRHSRTVWRSDVFANLKLSGDCDPIGSERKLLATVREVWQDALERYEPPDHDETFVRELRAISASAHRALT